MSFMAGVLAMWLMLGTISRTPTKLWLPTGVILTLLALAVIRQWTDLSERDGWSEGLLVGGLTGALALQFLFHRSRKKELQLAQQPSDRENSAGPGT